MTDMQRLFVNWPDSIPRAGLVVTSLGENVPFIEFQVSGGLLLLERRTPDSVGGRRVIVPMENVATLKIINAVEMSKFAAMGFQQKAVAV